MKEDNALTILIADDDEDDRMFTKEAFDENFEDKEIRFVNDGVKCLDYLRRKNKYFNPTSSPRLGHYRFNIVKLPNYKD